MSISVSTISLVLIGRFLSLGVGSVLLVICTFIWTATLGWEGFQLRRSSRAWVIGWRPFGGIAVVGAFAWIALVVFSLVDIQRGQNLFSTFVIWDHSARISWIESVLRTGIPPANPLYFYGHVAIMRNYYFWYVICASVAQISHLPARAIMTASCIWAGFALAAIVGLYLKHFLHAGTHLRKQFLIATSLLLVTGFDIVANVWQIFFRHHSFPLDLEWWSNDPIYGWCDSILWAPHHVTSMVCCFFAFLLVHIDQENTCFPYDRIPAVIFIAVALAGAFGMSIFVPFGFFLVMLTWGMWQVFVLRAPRPAIFLAVGGTLATVLLLPYLWDLTHNSSKMHGGAVFGLAIRQILLPNAFLITWALRLVSAGHPTIARGLAQLVLLIPGYIMELGFYSVVLIVCLVPAWRSRWKLTLRQRSLVFIAIATIPFISFIRSLVLVSNDFGWRAALILQFPLLLLASELIMYWRTVDRANDVSGMRKGSKIGRSIAYLVVGVGALSTASQLLVLRFDVPLLEMSFRGSHNSQPPGIIAHNAYISYLGFRQLSSSAPSDSVLQFNPIHPRAFWKSIDLINANRQIAMAGDELWCGSELGGDPGGCPAMIAAIDPLFNGAPAEQARAVCHEFGIQFLVANVYDPVWKDQQSWVWRLPPVVADPEFRALDCR